MWYMKIKINCLCNACSVLKREKKTYRDHERLTKTQYFSPYVRIWFNQTNKLVKVKTFHVSENKIMRKNNYFVVLSLLSSKSKIFAKKQKVTIK